MTVAARDRSEETQERARVQSLNGLIAELKDAGDLSREEFARLFAKAQRVLELDDTTVARALQIARPTVGRWARGESAPHALGRKPTFQWLMKQAQQKLASYS